MLLWDRKGLPKIRRENERKLKNWKSVCKCLMCYLRKYWIQGPLNLGGTTYRFGTTFYLTSNFLLLWWFLWENLNRVWRWERNRLKERVKCGGIFGGFMMMSSSSSSSCRISSWGDNWRIRSSFGLALLLRRWRRKLMNLTCLSFFLSFFFLYFLIQQFNMLHFFKVKLSFWSLNYLISIGLVP